MVEGAGGRTFPVIVFDGEREMKIGNVRIEAKQVYKAFQCMIAEAIRVSPNQISIYLLDRSNRLKMPITANTDFAHISQQRNCSFLVILKPSRNAISRTEESVSKYSCQECTTAFNNGKAADFHLCVNDAVVREFRTCAFGPIGPTRR